jgi:hypothetical protein
VLGSDRLANPPAVPERATAAAHAAAVLSCFCALSVLLFLPLSLHPASRTLGWGPDERLFLWTLGWDVHALLHQPLRPFDANIFFPERHTLAYSENLLGSALLGAPVLLATGNLVLTANLVVLAAYALSGAGAYFLARRIGLGTGGAAIAGVVYAFAPPHFFRYAQLHLATVQWMPFALGFLHAYAGERRRRDLLAACAFFTLQTATSGHAGLFLGLAGLGLLAYLALRGRLPPPSRLARDVGLAGGVVLGASGALLWPYHQVRRDVGLRRDVGGLEKASANAGSWIASPTHVHRTLLSLVPAAERRAATARSFLFPGWLTLALAALALARPRRLGDAAFYGLLAAAAFWICLGPRFGLYAALYRILPGFDFVRVPTRFGILWLVSLAVLAGAGFESSTARLAARARRLAAAACLALLVTEFAALPLEAPSYSVEVPDVDRWLAGRSGPVVELPVSDPADGMRASGRHTHYMLHSTVHWLPLVNGYSGWQPPLHDRLFRELASFPDATSLASLEALGVRWVVVHRGAYRRGEWRRAEAGFAGFADRLVLEHEAGGDRIYSLRATVR